MYPEVVEASQKWVHIFVSIFLTNFQNSFFFLKACDFIGAFLVGAQNFLAQKHIGPTPRLVRQSFIFQY